MLLNEIIRDDDTAFQLRMALRLLKSKGFDVEIVDKKDFQYVKVNQDGLEPSHLFPPDENEDGWMVTGVKRAKVGATHTISTGNAYDVPFNDLVSVLTARAQNFAKKPKSKTKTRA